VGLKGVNLLYIYIKCDNRSTVDYDVLNNIGLLNIENRVKHKTAFGPRGQDEISLKNRLMLKPCNKKVRRYLI
jgi:hypothetical protein